MRSAAVSPRNSAKVSWDLGVSWGLFSQDIHKSVMAQSNIPKAFLIIFFWVMGYIKSEGKRTAPAPGFID